MHNTRFPQQSLSVTGRLYMYILNICISNYLSYEINLKSIHPFHNKLNHAIRYFLIKSIYIVLFLTDKLLIIDKTINLLQTKLINVIPQHNEQFGYIRITQLNTKIHTTRLIKCS